MKEPDDTISLLFTDLKQDLNAYLPEDHATWNTLYNNQVLYIQKNAFTEFRDGFFKLNLEPDKVADIERISSNLESISGWSLIPVTGLLPTKEFFCLLINKCYPVTIYLRKPSEINFSEQPDIFHDVVGHLPLLTNEKFTRFLTAFSTLALKYIDNEQALNLLGRLYWFTYETGIVKMNDTYYPYGGAIITSVEEIENINNPFIPKHPFNIEQIFNSDFSPYSLQKEYFLIESFDDLFNCIDLIEPCLTARLALVDSEQIVSDFTLNEYIGSGFNDVIGFLNDMQYRYPEAISFVSGQPDEAFFELDQQIDAISQFVDYQMKSNAKSRKDTLNKIGQYSKTKGIVNDLIADYLFNDENINISSENLLITVGAQEAFAVIAATICDRATDMILIEDPCYIGLSSFCKVFDYNIAGVQTDEDGMDMDALEAVILEKQVCNQRVKLVYVIPDYQNPSGFCMSLQRRQRLLDLALQYNFLIIEDSVYNSFTYQQKKNPSLKSIDRFNRVIYVGSFAKSLFPGLRIGMIAADQKIISKEGTIVNLIDQMAKVKVQLTNNTSTISQAILGGMLLEQQRSLDKWNQPKFESYKQKRNCILEALELYIGQHRGDWAHGVKWNHPDGGFFIKMSLPFDFDYNSVITCASEYNIIICPMRFFYLNGGGENEIRLTFSNVPLDKIHAGIKQLATYIKNRINITKA